MFATQSVALVGMCVIDVVLAYAPTVVAIDPAKARKILHSAVDTDHWEHLPNFERRGEGTLEHRLAKYTAS